MHHNKNAQLICTVKFFFMSKRVLYLKRFFGSIAGTFLAETGFELKKT